MKVETKILKDFLWVYRNEANYLKNVKVYENKVIGKFKIHRSIYLKEDVQTNHFNLGDLVICYNQLAFVGLAYGIKTKQFTELLNIDYTFFKNNFLNSFIYSTDALKWNKVINSKEFKGELKIDKIKKLNNTYFVKTSFNFEYSVKGKIGLAMNLEKLS